MRSDWVCLLVNDFLPCWNEVAEFKEAQKAAHVNGPNPPIAHLGPYISSDGEGQTNEPLTK